MFGESDSESPRTGSPWDALVPDNDGPAKHSNVAVPKLVPEVEQGNVEYKLKLVNPTAERFARLVTQLKWRLLEGGGQAFYELGVADSGQLVGLSRLHLEQSLQTLEEMAGEIGASVIVVKEIELPSALVELATKNQVKPDGAMRMPKRRVEVISESYTESEYPCTEGEEENELSTPDGEEDQDIDTPCSLLLSEAKIVSSSFGLRSHPDRPTTQSSPTVFPVDDDLLDAGAQTDLSELQPIDLEISSVYKPRPTRRRAPPSTAVKGPCASAPVNIPSSNRRQWKAEKWAAKQEGKVKHRDLKSKGRRRDAPSIVVEDLSSVHSDDIVSALVPSLQALHLPGGEKLATKDVSITDDIHEGRYIVEVMIVRKMSLEEAFLDFGGFSTEVGMEFEV